jgi:hypothetical protein
LISAIYKKGAEEFMRLTALNVDRMKSAVDGYSRASGEKVDVSPESMVEAIVLVQSEMEGCTFCVPVACSRTMKAAAALFRLASILFDLARDVLRFLLLGTRSSTALKAENIFLRKQLALYLERKVKPRRATDANRRDPDHDDGDLYIARRQPDGSWTDPVSLGETVNSPTQERFPAVSTDGKYLFFTRYTPGYDEDVYWVDAASIPALRSITNLPKENPK